ncbi:glucosaminidase domain-containing protein [Chromobacterium vaccinii]|uniref:glucosaminidase domain-containing protein n=1 Tax=Chromobacterium vaccinii TaxID=1108595 RepID=UPI001E35FF07|nr:glucosaminidase domain-containing protein [Chromobacterium vaccinii]MCD4483070.1 glucosaminidase domain-containing protein [Chromobacterium vaccinii]
MPDPKKVEFIRKIYGPAKKASEKSGMSLELILTQAALETGWGQKFLDGSNNAFNIKASGADGWKGKTRYYDVPEVINGKTVIKHEKFRVYDTIEDSINDRIKFLKGNKRYKGIFKEGVKGDFSKEVEEIAKAGYATDPKYQSLLHSVNSGSTMRAGIEAGKKIEATSIGKIEEKKAINSKSILDEISNIAQSETSQITNKIWPKEKTQSNNKENEIAAEKTSLGEKIILAAKSHFKPGKYEYGRSDSRSKNKSSNGKTDTSRLEEDADGDGLKGVDCSALVWRALKESGVPLTGLPSQAGFTTSSLFNGSAVTELAKKNFTPISKDKALEPGAMKPGDLMMFSGKGGQHVAIFEGYDKDGKAKFFGSQTSTGPASTYLQSWEWKKRFKGALRLKNNGNQEKVNAIEGKASEAANTVIPNKAAPTTPHNKKTSQTSSQKQADANAMAEKAKAKQHADAEAAKQKAAEQAKAKQRADADATKQKATEQAKAKQRANSEAAKQKATEQAKAEQRADAEAAKQKAAEQAKAKQRADAQAAKQKAAEQAKAKQHADTEAVKQKAAEQAKAKQHVDTEAVKQKAAEQAKAKQRADAEAVKQEETEQAQTKIEAARKKEPVQPKQQATAKPAQKQPAQAKPAQPASPGNLDAQLAQLASLIGQLNAALAPLAKPIQITVDVQNGNIVAAVNAANSQQQRRS